MISVSFRFLHQRTLLAALAWHEVELCRLEVWAAGRTDRAPACAGFCGNGTTISPVVVP
jgi:hypothetical protein